MIRFRLSTAACLGVLGLGLCLLQTPAHAEEAAQEEAAPQGDIAMGVASLKKSTERVTALVKEVQERCAKQVQEGALEGLVQLGPRVFDDYTALRVPLEVMVVQTALLAADRVGSETVMVDGPALLKGRMQQAFGVNWEDIDKLHGQKLSWSEVVLGLAIAKITEKKVDDLVAQVKEGKTWPEVATAAGLQVGKLPELIGPLFREQ